jgi:hypothetical protein
LQQQLPTFWLSCSVFASIIRSIAVQVSLSKKARTLEAAAAKAEQWFDEVWQRYESHNMTTKEMLRMTEASTEESKKNCEVFKEVFET